MRDIKFRCWDVENKEILNVDLLDFDTEVGYKNKPVIRTAMYSDYFDREEMILMQYTRTKR